MKAITLKIDTYRKSIAIRMAVKDRIETLHKIVSSSSLSDKVKDLFREELVELEIMHKHLEDF